MDLLDRYLAAVRRNLPAKDADDIIAELRDVLLAQAEEREERYGHVDWTGLLREFGHPLTVAARYRPQQWLIGPELYPFYLYFLKMIAGIVAVVVVVTAVGKAVLHAGPPGPMIVDLLGSLWWSVAGTVGSVTIVFALIERYGGVDRHFRNWAPDELPELPDLSELVGKPKSGWGSAFECAMGLLFLLWWAGAIHLPLVFHNDTFRLEGAPIWTQLYWPILALLAGRLAYNVLRWLMPRAKWLIGLFGIVTAVGGVILAALIYKAGIWMSVVPVSMAAEEAAKIQDSLNLALRIAIVVVAIIWTLQSLGELWRWMRGTGRR
jgi:hypothetical protein